MHITPKLRAGLRAIAASPTHRLVRCPGGYRPDGAAAPVVTTRTVNSMERGYLVSFEDDAYPPSAVLTAKGRRVAYDVTEQPARATA